MRSRAFHLMAIALIVLPSPMVPATITVDGTDGVVAVDGVCTLPEAIDNANDDAMTHADCATGILADDIVLTGDVTLTSRNNGAPGSGNGLPVITTVMTIEGGDFTIARDGGSEPFRIFRLQIDGDLTLNDVTVTGGLIANTSSISVGGGIFNNGGTLTMNNSTLSNSTASAVGDSYAYGGGLYNKGLATLNNSTVSGNSAEVIDVDISGQRVGGGGIANCAYECLGGADPELVLTASTVSGNSATVIVPDGSTFSSGSYGGGIYSFLGTVTLTNSTVSDNSGYSLDSTGFNTATGGGILEVYADLSLVNTTLSGNTTTAPYGDGMGAAIDYFGFGTSPTIEFTNTIFGNHLPGYTCMTIDPAHNISGNLADDATCGSIPATLTLLDATLADNGGPTQTNALLAGSTAIDAGGACALAEDQRGVLRSDGLCDSGSFEVAAACAAPQGEDFVVPDGITAVEETFETCNSLTVNDRDVVGPDGHLILRTAGTVQINDGMEVGLDGRLTIDIDGTITMPDEQ